MGKIEKRSEAILRKTRINGAIIGALQGAGFLAVAMVAPKAVGMLGKMKLLPQERYRVQSALARMIEMGYVRLEKGSGAQKVRLTEKGEAFALLIAEGQARPKKPKRWDGKWRLVIYDLKNVSVGFRARVRSMLRSFGFVLLQNSVWAYPYDCEDLIFILKQELKLGGSLLYIIADQIENDRALRARFSLPSQRD